MKKNENLLPTLKIFPEYFEQVLSGNKRAELRLNDRDFKVGDSYALCEYNPTTKDYTGRKIEIQITNVIGQFEGLKEGWCMFSFKTHDELFEVDDKPSWFEEIDFEKEYNHSMTMNHNLREERDRARTAIIALSSIIENQQRHITQLNNRLDEDFKEWRKKKDE